MMVLVSGGAWRWLQNLLWMRQIRSKVTTIYVHGE